VSKHRPPLVVYDVGMTSLTATDMTSLVASISEQPSTYEVGNKMLAVNEFSLLTTVIRGISGSDNPDEPLR